MLERQNAELVSFINISSKEFVYIKQQQSEQKSSKNEQTKKNHGLTLKFRCESTGLFQTTPLWTEAVIKKQNSQCTVYYLYCHNLQPLANQQQLRKECHHVFSSYYFTLFRINLLVAMSVLQNSPWHWGCPLEILRHTESFKLCCQEWLRL